MQIGSLSRRTGRSVRSPAAWFILAGLIMPLYSQLRPGGAPPVPAGFVSRASGCLSQGQAVSEQAASTGVVEIFGDGNALVCRHRRVIFNCCATPSMTLHSSGSEIDFIEWENLAAPCDCLCPYDLEGRQDQLPDGSYTVRLIRGDSGEELATAAVDLPAAGFTYAASACLANSSGRPGLELEVGDGFFALRHSGVTGNCCAVMTVSIERTGQRFDFMENEVFPAGSAPCFCTCPFDLSLKMSGLAAGEYEVHLWNADRTVEYYQDTIIISPPGYRLTTSPCRPDDGPATEQIRIMAVHGTVVLQHRPVRLNCCADPMIHLVAMGSALSFVEQTHQNAPCDCTCRYDLEGRMDGLPAGFYQVDLWRGLGGELLASEVVEVEATPFPDLNGDGFIDAADRALLAELLLDNGPPRNPWADLTDVNGDGRTDVADLVLLGL